MLTIIYGRAKSGKTTRLLEHLKAAPVTEMAGNIVIVPEQIGHQTERLLAEKCGNEISFTTEVLSMTRLYHRVCALHGGGARRTMDEGGRILTARTAVSGMISELHVFASNANRPEFLQELIAAMDEFRQYEVDAGTLMDAAGKTEGSFSQKLRELGLLMGAYDAITAQGDADPRDCLTILARKLRESGYAKGRHFYIDGFTDFTAQELDVLRELLNAGREVYVTLPCEDLARGAEIFDVSRQTLGQLLELARQAGVQVISERMEYQRELPPALIHLERELLNAPAAPFAEAQTAVRLVTAPDVLSECRQCAACLKDAAMKGMRYRDMMVCACDADAYAPAMQMIAAHLGIPLSVTEKHTITSHPLVSFLLSALDAAAGGMEAEDVLACLKSGYMPVRDGDRDRIENYVRVWKIRGRGWSRPWLMNPEGFDGKERDPEDPAAVRLNEAKDRAAAPLLHLAAGIGKAENVLGQMEAFYHFLEEIDLHTALTHQVSRYVNEGNSRKAEETRQIWKALMNCCQQTVDILGDAGVEPEELRKLLSLILGSYQLAAIPTSLDSVAFGSLQESRGKEPKLMYILGAVEGSFPTGSDRRGLLSEHDRAELKQSLQITLGPDLEETLLRELYHIYCALSAPTEQLILSYPASDAGETARPSYMTARVAGIFSLEPEMAEDDDLWCLSDAAEAYYTDDPEDITGAAERLMVDRAAETLPSLRELLDAAAYAERDTHVRQELADKLFPSPQPLSATKLDKLADCPLAFFLRYGMGAKPIEETDLLNAREFGTYIHAVLQNAVKELMETGETLPITPERSRELTERFSAAHWQDRFAGAEPGDREKYLYDRNGLETERTLESISEELSASEFTPFAYELPFGQGGGSEYVIQGEKGSGYLQGYIDRADRYDRDGRTYIRVNDYKSGAKDVDYGDLVRGRNLQLLLYLRALGQLGLPGETENKPLPAAGLYIPTKESFLAEDGPGEDEKGREKARKRKGFILKDDPEILEALEKGDKHFLPVSKKGAVKNGFTGEEFERLGQFVEDRTRAAVDSIYSGDYPAKPYYAGAQHNACNYCDYAAICQKDADYRRQFYAAPVKEAQFRETYLGGEDNG